MIVVLTLRRLAAIVLLTALTIWVLVALRPDIQPVSALNGSELPTLIIDAGHGGIDGGAVSVNGICESVINLDIAKRMAAISQLLGYPVLMTRETEELIYPDSLSSISKKKRYDQQQRVEFINATENAVLLSIHQNSFPSAAPFGPQSFHTKDAAAQSLATLVQESLNAALCPENRRVASPVARDIYLMKSIDCSGVLVECGFLSNKKEAALLETGEYRLKTACAVMSAYARHLCINDEIR